MSGLRIQAALVFNLAILGLVEQFTVGRYSKSLHTKDWIEVAKFLTKISIGVVHEDLVKLLSCFKKETFGGSYLRRCESRCRNILPLLKFLPDFTTALRRVSYT